MKPRNLSIREENLSQQIVANESVIEKKIPSKEMLLIEFDSKEIPSQELQPTDQT